MDHFDVYLLHWLNQKNYEICEKYDEFAFLRELKAQGTVGKTGFSYHDSAALLDEILTAHPETEVVQLQLNYLDWDSPSTGAWRQTMQRPATASGAASARAAVPSGL